jgi:hypothetical protein
MLTVVMGAGGEPLHSYVGAPTAEKLLQADAHSAIDFVKSSLLGLKNKGLKW